MVDIANLYSYGAQHSKDKPHSDHDVEISGHQQANIEDHLTNHAGPKYPLAALSVRNVRQPQQGYTPSKEKRSTYHSNEQVANAGQG